MVENVLTNPGEGLRLIWPNGVEVNLLPSKGDTSLTFAEYDAAYSYLEKISS